MSGSAKGKSKRLAHRLLLHSRAPDYVLRDRSSEVRRHGFEYDAGSAPDDGLRLLLLHAELVRRVSFGMEWCEN